MINVNRNLGKVDRDWMDAALEIKELRGELSAYQSIMTPYERQVISRQIKKLVERDYDLIYAGAAGELNAAADKFTAAKEAIQAARQKELTRWDAVKLGAEMQALNMLIGQAVSTSKSGGVLGRPVHLAAELENIYDEYQRTGDTHKQRAAAEVMRTLAGRADMPREVAVNLLARKAEEDLASMRVTDEMKAAFDAANQAQNEVMEAKKVIAKTAEVMGEDMAMAGLFPSSKFAKAYNRVQVDPKTRELIIYDEDSRETSGIIPPMENSDNG